MHDWIDNLLQLGHGALSEYTQPHSRSAQNSVLISVVQTHGSCPREVGTHMIVAADTCIGTIGGGHLEYQAIAIAHDLLNLATPAFRIERFPLGARLGQCCGGVAHLSFEFVPINTPAWVNTLHKIRHNGEAAIMVSALDDNGNKFIVTEQSTYGSFTDSHQQHLAANRAMALLQHCARSQPLHEDGLLYESIYPETLSIVVFGAGHVGRALVNVLSTLPCTVIWIDSRANEFPDNIPANVHRQITDQPEHEVDSLPNGTHVVIMTHSHALDQAICERVLCRDDIAWCGLIGSESKRRQFDKRLLARGLPISMLSKLTCPIGIDGISGKHPSQIAISVAAQLQLTIDTQQR